MLNKDFKEKLKRLEKERQAITYARNATYNAIRYGRIVKTKCHCGESKVEAHHVDYSKPLEVVFLCKTHNAQADKKKRETDLAKTTGILL